MKRLYLFLIVATAWMAGGYSAVANYPVTLAPGLQTFANHLGAPLDLKLVTTWPGIVSVSRWNYAFGSYSTSVYDPDAGGWSDPGGAVIAPGEGVFIDNDMNNGGPISFTVSGPGGTVVPSPLSVGLFFLGRQSEGPGTFESILGRSPNDYSSAVVYRFDPTGTGPIYFGGGHFEEFHFYNNQWSPSAPVLNLGEAAFFQLGNLTATTPSGFTVNGVTPHHGVDGTPFTLQLTGTDFSTISQDDSVELQLSGSLGTIPGVVDWALSDPYVLTVNFSPAGAASGYYDVKVYQNGVGTAHVLPDAFYLKPSGSSLSLRLIGRTLTRLNWYDTYYLCVKNNGSAVSGVDISGTIPAGMTFANIAPTPGLVGSTFTVSGISLNANEEKYFPFGLTATSSLLLNQTVHVIGKILAPVAVVDETDEVQLPIEIVVSIDPNAKSGPAGTGPERFIKGLDSMDYAIAFENKPTATAPAQEVVISDPIDVSKLDLSTFEIGPITFGTKVVVPPAGLKAFTTNVPYDVDGDPQTPDDNILVSISVALDNNLTSPTFGRAQWTFRSLASAPPHAPVALANLGFLPPNTATPQGQGSVAFRIRAHSNLATGDTLTNGASITFDDNEAILTALWVNTIDHTRPDSRVNSLPAVQTTSSFLVSWSGVDAGAGILSYDVYVSDNNGPFTLWQHATTALSATFDGQDGHSYGFYSIATDQVGNTEDQPEAADATTAVQLAPSTEASYTVTLPRGLNILVNHFGQPMTLAELFPSLPTIVTVGVPNRSTGSFDSFTYDPDIGWTGSPTLCPGQAFYFENSEPSLTITLSGPPGVARLPLVLPAEPFGFMLGRQTVGPGTYESMVGSAPEEGMAIWRIGGGLTPNEGLFFVHRFANGVWTPSAPLLREGEGCVLTRGAMDPNSGRGGVFQPTSILNQLCGSVAPGEPTLSVEPLPACVRSQQVLLNGLATMTGAGELARVVYSINDGPAQTLCDGNCGNSFVIAQAIELQPCENRVTLVATDTAARTVSHTFTVVSDTAGPLLTGDADITLLAPSGQTQAQVTYAVTATDNCPGPVTLTLEPESGFSFPLGVTTVTARAKDACGNSTVSQFKVTVIARKADLFLEDTPYNYTGAPDLGDEPEDANMVGQPMWTSRAIWVHEDYQQPAGTYQSHQNPRMGQTNGVFVQVKNRGNSPSAAAQLQVYYANASAGLAWPADWTLLGEGDLPSIADGDTYIASLPWLPPGTGHYCLVARIVSAEDGMFAEEGSNINGNVRSNNNIAWRNVNVMDLLRTTGNSVEVRLRHTPRARHANQKDPHEPTAIMFTTDEGFLTEGGEAEINLGPLFGHWQAAGGRGTNVIALDGTRVRLTGSPARMDDLPLFLENDWTVNLVIRAPRPMQVAGTAHLYNVHLIQNVEGEPVGGVSYGVLTRAQDTDTDHDGIPDVADPDDDGDGISDEDDITPAGDSDCAPAQLHVRRVGHQKVMLSWSGLGYRLEATSRLFEGWQEVPRAHSPLVLDPEDYMFFRLICR